MPPPANVNKKNKTYYDHLLVRYGDEIMERCRDAFPQDRFRQQSLYDDILIRFWENVDKIAGAVERRRIAGLVSGDDDGSVGRYEHNYVFKTARYVIRDSLRRYRKELLHRPVEELPDIADPSTVESPSILDDLVDRLDVEDRAFVQQYLAGYTPAEIGNIDGCSKSTAYRRFNAIIQKLIAINNEQGK